MKTREDVLAVYAQGPDAVSMLMLALVARVNALETRVETLAAERAKDTHNSGKPPSTDVTRAERAAEPARAERQGTGRHPGRTLALRATPDAVLTRAADTSARCGHAFTAAPARVVATEQRQMFELPPLALTDTEHRVAERHCARCGAWTRGAFPPEAPSTVQYGPGVLALGV